MMGIPFAFRSTPELSRRSPRHSPEEVPTSSAGGVALGIWRINRATHQNLAESCCQVSDCLKMSDRIISKPVHHRCRVRIPARDEEVSQNIPTRIGQLLPTVCACHSPLNAYRDPGDPRRLFEP